MKTKRILTAVITFCISINLSAQSDAIYLMKDGRVFQKVLLSEIDSVVFYPYIHPADTFTDSRDGYMYQVVKIGNQFWMAENLRYLPEVMEVESSSSTTPCYYVYDYDGTNIEEAKASENYQRFGVLYNWPAAMAGEESSNSNPSGVQGICPSGWHLPSQSEWDELVDHLGGDGVAGTKLKATNDTLYWLLNIYSTNESGFSARGAGRHEISVSGPRFIGLRERTQFWSATITPSGIHAFIKSLNWNYPYANTSPLEFHHGLSIRCVKD
jgi:uncharacterized protein (TIGR02145 family)